MALKWPSGTSKIQGIGIGGSPPGLILAQLLEVSDQINTLVISVADAEGECQMFHTQMKNNDLAYHAMHAYSEITEILAGRAGAEIMPDDDAG